MVDVEERTEIKRTEFDGDYFPEMAVNIIRTTLRNNMELTGIADNKANVLLSLNTIMLTIVMPLAWPHREWIIDHYLHIPLIIILITCLITIYYAAKVLQPSNLNQQRAAVFPSPFFFGNFYKMESQRYYEYLQSGVSSPNQMSAHLAQDLYFLGKRLGRKMSWVRLAFQIFMTGMFLSVITTVIVLFFIC